MSSAEVILVTGTDTGIGKTTVAAGLGAAMSQRGLRVGVLKPAETGCAPQQGLLIAADARRLAFFAGCTADEATICPYRFQLPLAPRIAAQREGRSIALSTIIAACERLAGTHDLVIVEGAGGLLVPLCEGLTFADLCDRLQARLLVVVGNKLGAINHALLTMRYAEHAQLPVIGYIVNAVVPDQDLAAETNVEVLRELLGEPLGVIPWLGQVAETEEDRKRLAELFGERVDLSRVLQRWPGQTARKSSD